MKRTCSVDGCETESKTRGMCRVHYLRWYRRGTTHDITPEERFWAKVDKTETCWLWTGSQRGNGYGQVNDRALPSRLPHRVAYIWAHGPVPDGMVLDHKCRAPLCVNPDHLHPVTQQQNTENRVASPVSKTGVRGVSWHKKARKWIVFVGHAGESHYGGLFERIEDAEAAAIALRNRLMTNNLTDRPAD